MTTPNAAALALLIETATRVEVRRQLARHGDALRALQHLRADARAAIAERMRRSAAAGVTLLDHAHPAFPARLATIPDPPLLLHVGAGVGSGVGSAAPDLSADARPVVAIVGARRASRSGLELASALACELAALGVVIVSGLALGIDAAAHLGALASERAGPTVAVLGSGLGCVQPVRNRGLARRIVAAGGALLSEYPHGRGARRFHFPERNRLISGLADAVVIVEAGERSGSLITARLALEQGREVLAVPGSPVQPNARGVNRLIKQGAGLVESARDVLDALGHVVTVPSLPPPAATVSLTRTALDVLAALDVRAASLDVLCAATGLTAERALAVLAELELEGFVARVGGGYIRRPR